MVRIKRRRKKQPTTPAAVPRPDVPDKADLEKLNAIQSDVLDPTARGRVRYERLGVQLRELESRLPSDSPERNRARQLAELCELKRRGIQDYSSVGLGFWRGNEYLGPTLRDAEKKKKENDMAKVRKAREAKAARAKSKPKAKAKTKSKAKAKKKSTGRGGKPGRPKGTTTGLPIQAAWVHIFEQNRKAPKKKRLTDDQISEWMKKEFPGRKSKVFDMVNSVRTKFNKGGLTKGEVPKVESVPYDEDGNITEVRRGRKAKA